MWLPSLLGTKASNSSKNIIQGADILALQNIKCQGRRQHKGTRKRKNKNKTTRKIWRVENEERAEREEGRGKREEGRGKRRKRRERGPGRMEEKEENAHLSNTLLTALSDSPTNLF